MHAHEYMPLYICTQYSLEWSVVTKWPSPHRGYNLLDSTMLLLLLLSSVSQFLLPVSFKQHLHYLNPWANGAGNEFRSFPAPPTTSSLQGSLCGRLGTKATKSLQDSWDPGQVIMVMSMISFFSLTQTIYIKNKAAKKQINSKYVNKNS